MMTSGKRWIAIFLAMVMMFDMAPLSTFADPEEELKQIDAPQDIIDMNRAYRQPVYPRGWKRNEDHEE